TKRRNKKGRRPMALSTTKGLLAFIWDIYTNPTKASAFKESPATFMTPYELTIDQQRVIWETGLDRTAPENAQAWIALGAGGVPGAPPNPPGKYKDSGWATNEGAMALLGSMLVDILSGDPQFDDAW